MLAMPKSGKGLQGCTGGPGSISIVPQAGSALASHQLPATPTLMLPPL